MDIQVAAIDMKAWSWSKFGTALCFALAAGFLIVSLIHTKKANADVSAMIKTGVDTQISAR